MSLWIESPTVELDLDRPMGERYREMPPEVIDQGRQLLDNVVRQIPRLARALGDAVRLRTANRFQAEATALADLVGSSWREIMLANISYDLVLSSLGCSTVAVATARGPVVARNMDWWPEDILARASCLVRTTHRGELLFANAGWPGSIGAVTGLSGRGFAIVLNAVMCPEGSDKTGYPVLLHIRRVLEDAEDFDTALEMLTDERLAAPALLMLVGSRNEQRVVVERTPRRHALRWAEGDAPLVSTNDYRRLDTLQSDALGDLSRTTCSRYDRLYELASRLEPHTEVEDDFLLYLLTDPSVIQNITAQHILLRPSTGQVRLFVPRRFVEP